MYHTNQLKGLVWPATLDHSPFACMYSTVLRFWEQENNTKNNCATEKNTVVIAVFLAYRAFTTYKQPFNTSAVRPHLILPTKTVDTKRSTRRPPLCAHERQSSAFRMQVTETRTGMHGYGEGKKLHCAYTTVLHT